MRVACLSGSQASVAQELALWGNRSLLPCDTHDLLFIQVPHVHQLKRTVGPVFLHV